MNLEPSCCAFGALGVQASTTLSSSTSGWDISWHKPTLPRLGSDWHLFTFHSLGAMWLKMWDGHREHWVVQNAGVKLTAETQAGRLLPAATGDGG